MLKFDQFQTNHHTTSKPSLSLFQIFNMYILNSVLLNFWSSYAPAISSLLSGNYQSWMVNTAHVFPKLSKCDFFKYGPSGSQETRDALCLLSLNVLNDKIFAIIYVWFIFLLIISAINLILCLVTLVSKRYRIYCLRSVLMFEFSDSQLRRVTNQANTGDCFVFRQMARNLDSGMFVDLVADILAMKKSRRVSFSDEWTLVVIHPVIFTSKPIEVFRCLAILFDINQLIFRFNESVYYSILY